jgi:hypothetical protein
MNEENSSRGGFASSFCIHPSSFRRKGEVVLEGL